MTADFITTTTTKATNSHAGFLYEEGTDATITIKDSEFTTSTSGD